MLHLQTSFYFCCIMLLIYILIHIIILLKSFKLYLNYVILNLLELHPDCSPTYITHAKLLLYIHACKANNQRKVVNSFEISRAHTSSQARDSGFRHVLARQVLNHVAALFRAASDIPSVRYHNQYQMQSTSRRFFCVVF